MSFLGSLVGGVLGLFGNKKQKTESTVDYVKMAANATAAGFNPLTAIRNGGSAGFTTTTTPSASSLPGALQSIGGALGEAYERKVDPFAQKQRQYDTALVDYQLRQLKEGPKAVSGTLYPGGQMVGTKVTRVKPQMAKPAAPTELGQGTLVPGDNPKVSGLGWNNGKYGLFHNPWMPDGESVETIYGDNELISTVYGLGKIGLDGVYSGYRNARSLYGDSRGFLDTHSKRNPRLRKVYLEQPVPVTVIPQRSRPRSGGGGW